MHSLISSYLRPLEGGGEALINRRLMTPGGITEYRIPDVQLLDINYSTPTVSGVWDFKAVNLNEYSYRLSPQFMDIRRATSITPTPLYYRLPVQRTLRPPPGL
jgi:hypothetical protein